MKKVPLTRGKFALVSDEDYERVMQLKWRAEHDGHNWYAIRTERVATGWRKIALHRYVLDLPKGQGIVDHVNGNPLDNRRENLRVVTHSENSRNRRRTVRNSTGFKGVVAFARHQDTDRPYCARIGYDGTDHEVGRFATAEEAARAYDAEALRVFGQFARLNFPREKHQ